MKPLSMYRVLASSFEEDPKEMNRKTGTLMIYEDEDQRSMAVYVEDDTGFRKSIEVGRVEVIIDERHPTRSVIQIKKLGSIAAQFIAYKQMPVDGNVVRMNVVRAVATPKARVGDGEAESEGVVRDRSSEQ